MTLPRQPISADPDMLAVFDELSNMATVLESGEIVPETAGGRARIYFDSDANSLMLRKQDGTVLVIKAF